MRRTLTLATAAAVAALTTMAAVPAAHADQTFTGTITDSDASTSIREPDHATEACTNEMTTTFPAIADTVTLTAQIGGERRFVLTPTGTMPDVLAFYVYRNGVCVKADYAPDDDDPKGTIDVDHVAFAAGDRITVQIATLVQETLPLAWRLTVHQPEPVRGAAKAAAIGKGTRYASLPAAISCARRQATVKFTTKARKQVKKAVIKVNGKQVKKLTSLKRKPVTVKHLPAGTTSLTVVLTLKNHKKVSVQRGYWAC
jgi:hypothetical protein